MKRSIVAALILMFISTLWFLSGCNNPTGGGGDSPLPLWNIQTVDVGSNDYFGSLSSVTVNNSNEPCAAYADPNYPVLKYARWNSSTNKWDIRSGSVSCGWSVPVIQLNVSMEPIIFYGAINRAKWNSNISNWATSTIVSSSSWNVAHDKDNNIGLCYVNGTSLNYIQFDQYASSWESELVDASANVGGGVSLSYDMSNLPIIGYYDSTNKRFMYAKKNGGSWDVSIIVTADSISRIARLNAYSGLLKINSQNQICVFVVSSEVGLYIHQTSVGWTWEAMQLPSYGGYYSFGLNANDEPNFSYECNWDGSVWKIGYCYKQCDSWYNEIIDSTPWFQIVQQPFMDMDNNHKPVISYFYTNYKNNGTVKLARRR